VPKLLAGKLLHNVWLICQPSSLDYFIDGPNPLSGIFMLSDKVPATPLQSQTRTEGERTVMLEMSEKAHRLYAAFVEASTSFRSFPNP
jgi:hypothetical protein